MSHETNSWALGVLSILTTLEEPPCTCALNFATCLRHRWQRCSTETAAQFCTLPDAARYIMHGWMLSFQRCGRRYKPIEPSTHAKRHPSKRRRKYIESETEEEKTINIGCRVWDGDTKHTKHRFRVHKNGTIFVEKEPGWWVQSYLTDMTYRQERQMRYIVWGSTREADTYTCLTNVPRMEVGARFWIRGEPENDGYYEFVDYLRSGGGVRIRRLLPDYCLMSESRLNRISNTPWESR